MCHPIGDWSCGRFPARIARRIVCDLRPGEVIPRGHAFGMIKLGSRTELIIPAEEGLEVKVRVGLKVKAGETVVAEYRV